MSLPHQHSASAAGDADMETGQDQTPSAPSPWRDHSSLIFQGAEARVFAVQFCGRGAVLKERFKKEYRHPALDARLTLRRLQGEARNLVKASKAGVRTPAVYAVDLQRHFIVMEKVQGQNVRDFLLSMQEHHCLALAAGASTQPYTVACVQVAQRVGEAIARLHDAGLVHGDLTTSNIILSAAPNVPAPAPAAAATSLQCFGGALDNIAAGEREAGNGAAVCSSTGVAAAPSAEPPLENGSAALPVGSVSVIASRGGNGGAGAGGEVQVVMIDFGLSFNSTIAEDKAVDLYVLERALLALHSLFDFMMDAVLESYCKTSRLWSSTFNRLAQVRARGRKRVMVG